jgi:hypothetical protein
MGEFGAETADEDRVVLTWTTATERKNDGFYVQHRRRGGADTTFSPLEDAFLQGAGTTSETQSYRYRTDALAVGTHQFRLKQVDQSGNVTYTDPVSVKIGMEQAFQFDTYPNPVQSQATVEFALREKGPVTIRLYNALGQQVRTVYDGPVPAEELQRHQLETERLSSGVYFLRLSGPSASATRQISIVR